MPSYLPFSRLNIKKLLLVFFLMLNHSVQADNAAITKTKTKLRELETKILKLQQILSTAHDKQEVLTQELSITEKKIGTGVLQLTELEKGTQLTQNKIYELQKQIIQLSSQLQAHQGMLSKHVRTRYQMGEYQPVKWLLNQDAPHQISRLLTFYQYLIKARQQLIIQVHELKNAILLNQEKLTTELTRQHHLEEEIKLNQKKLVESKEYHKALIHALDQDIQSNEQRLAEYKKNKINLSNLLKSLTQQSVYKTTGPFLQMRHKLPMPIQSNKKSYEKMHQGVNFFAPEGTPVYAVYNGKVVFSDWLKGYGLLIIVDHGQGFMTLYAHNQSLFKPKGSSVYQGEQIATVGHSGGFRQNSLYFEVRQRGKAVPPLDWLS